MSMASTTPLLSRKRPQPTLRPPLLRWEQPQPTLRSPLPPQPTLTPMDLPFDLVKEILCRLPAKHLLQLCCVCKSWNSLISADSNFAKKHLRLSNSLQDRHHLIQTITDSSPLPEVLLSQSPISSIFSSASTFRVAQFRYSLEEILNTGTGASTCDGIICFRIDNSIAVLCNPCIRKFKILPPLKFPHQSGDRIAYTLVYDRFIRSYKVIAVKSSRNGKTVELNIHTLGTDCWKRIQNFPAPLYLATRGVFVNDSVNWLAYAGIGVVPPIVSFDLENESYQMLSLPGDVLQLKTLIIFILGTLSGCLSLLFNQRDGDGFSEVWIMKEYGNENSWIKLFTVPQTDFGPYLRAIYISEDDKVLMECVKSGKNSLVVYDPISNTCEIPKFQNRNQGEMTSQPHIESDVKIFTSGIYVESLISPL
ncbi:F-box/kelch-repeat protein At3g23880-like [Vicia villosa]|uniref:F-box/kelch-repeat protein At3g23880-like n=1 Tax=Vicia villosa TaxID=3911 RepID=UPI00273BF5C7|nr:F-box/kelch-repeat protein At3g23880-like [Vicia villosa]XP_058758030.1 F-box/kelch-repeat protein At3g23880-like [Vicia villosa]